MRGPGERRPACRSGERPAAPAAHMLAITVLSRSEVSGATPLLPAATAAPGAFGPVAVEVGASHPVLGGALLGGHLVTVGSAHLAARDPVPRQVRRAVGAGVHGMVPSRFALVPLAHGLSGKVPPT
jgi:hypothetical protein